ncbi:unnamed protein product [Miscanthus lutarioriparius]|uniref:Uncharacterized protein n=1 Tax=Miscanthus lutarioriparius TaxID=422564 RepID=A0A811NC13_9POAL|nr:unnamed protein product [Miscanthus lutarioriparius]
MARGQLLPPLQSTAREGEAAAAGRGHYVGEMALSSLPSTTRVRAEAAVGLRRCRAWPLRWEDGAIAVAERGPCEGDASSTAATAAGHDPCAEGDGVVANQRGRAEVLSSTRPGAAASAAALGHGPRAWRDRPVAD